MLGPQGQGYRLPPPSTAARTFHASSRHALRGRDASGPYARSSRCGACAASSGPLPLPCQRRHTFYCKRKGVPDFIRLKLVIVYT